MNKVVLVGSSGHAFVIIDAIKKKAEFDVVGLLDELNPEPRTTKWSGIEVLGSLDLLPALKSNGIKHAFVGIGNSKARVRIAEKLINSGFQLPTIIHPTAVIGANVEIGQGTIILANAVVNCFTKIGAHAIINSNCVVEHDCNIGMGAHIAPGCALAGNVEVGELSWVGIGTSVREKIKIGARTTIGAGSVVVSDIISDTTAFGCPAKPRTNAV